MSYAIKKDIESNKDAFVCLVCRTETICVLDEEELQGGIDLGANKSQRI